MTMDKYIGAKMVQAEQMTRKEFHKHRGWSYPGDEKMEEAGYRVVYAENFEKWYEKEAFEKDYRLCGGMNFGLAIEAMKKGLKVARKGWNGKGMFLFIASGDDMSYCLFYNEMICIDSIVMKTADDKLCIGWLASQADMLSEDWVIVE